MLKQNYYEILELDQQAPAAEVKSHYRRLAKRYHPDLNPGNPQASRQFQQIHLAYEVLSDPRKRQQYDTQLGFVPTATREQPRAAANGPRPYRRYDNRQRQRPRTSYPVSKPTQSRADYNHYTIEVSLPELFKETKRSLTINQTFTCRRCRGKGKLETGILCERCGGYGFLVQSRRLEVTIPPGLQPNMHLRLEVGDGQPEHPLLDAPITTNIAATIELRSSSPFEYHDNQLYTTTYVPAALLASGGEWTIPAPEGGQFTFKIPSATVSGSVLTLRRHGLRNGSSQRRGNLLCTVIAQNNL